MEREREILDFVILRLGFLDFSGMVLFKTWSLESPVRSFEWLTMRPEMTGVLSLSDLISWRE